MNPLKVVLDEGAFLPERAHATDAGADLRTPIDVLIPARGSATIDTGVHMEIPNGYYGKIESKSGLNVKHGVVALGGVIDEGYTGSIVVKLYNMTDEDYAFSKGDKITQILIIPVAYPQFKIAESLDDSDRNTDGFGSTGK